MSPLSFELSKVDAKNEDSHMHQSDVFKIVWLPCTLLITQGLFLFDYSSLVH